MIKFAVILVLALLSYTVYSACVPGGSPTYTTDPAYAAKSVITRFPTSGECGGIGPIGIAFDNNKQLYVCYHPTGPIYKFNMNSPLPLVGAASGSVFAVTTCTGLVFDGRYLWAGTGNERELSRFDLSAATPVKEIKAVVASRILGMSIDASTGDIYMSLRTGQLGRYQRTTNQFQTLYKFQNGLIDGVTVDPIGKYLYGAALQTNKIIRIDLKSSSYVETTVSPLFGGADGIALASNTINPEQPPYLFVATNNGRVVKIDLSTTPATAKDIVTGGTRGDFAVVGPDGCFYATQSNSIVKVTNADGTCSLSPTSPHPIVGISSPAIQCGATVNVPAGTTQSVTFRSTSADPKNTISVSKDTTNSAGDSAAVSFSPSLPTPSLSSPIDVVATFSAQNALSAKVGVSVTDLFKATSSCSVTFCSVPKLLGGGCGVSTLTVSPAVSSPSVQYQLIKDGANVGVPQSSSTFTVNAAGSYSVKYTDSRTGCSAVTDVVKVTPPPTITATVSVPTVYLSAYTPKACTQVTCAVVGPTTLFSYEWLAPVNVKGATTQVCASSLKVGANTLTCKVTDASGCSATKTVTVNVIDARCGPQQKLDKVSICHVEPQKKDINLCLPTEAIEAHLTQHGDRLGPC